MDFLRGHSDVLERLVVEMYARGLSTRDSEDALKEATGDPLLSRAAVSELTDILWEDYEAFCQRDLSVFEVEYLFIDAVYEGLRSWGAVRASCAPGVSAGMGAKCCCTWRWAAARATRTAWSSSGIWFAEACHHQCW